MSGLLFKKLAASSLLLLSMLSCQSANAAFVMTLDDLNDSAAATVISDASSFDLNSLLGAITYSGTVGVFTVNISTAVSKPLTSSPLLSLNSFNVNGASPGNLRISITDTDYVSGSFPGVIAQATALLSSSDIRVSFLADPTNNAEFSGSTFATSPVLNNFVWDDYFEPIPNASGLYSLTIIADLFHTNPNTVSSFSASVSPSAYVVPLPGALLFFLTSLGGLLAFARKKS